MKAVVLKEFGPAQNLPVADVPIPSISDDEVLVNVKSFSINPVEAHVREVEHWWNLVSASTTADPHIILGWDVSGIITETGKNVTKFKKGDEVFGMINFLGYGAAYAEYVSAPVTDLALKPSNISFEEAAGATMAAQTAWVSLVRYGKVKKGDKVVITGASGGVGHFAVQIAKHFGAHVIGVASEENRDFVLSLGADEFVDYKTQNFEELITDADLVHDAVWRNDESHILRSLNAIKPGGTLLSLMVYPSVDFIEMAMKKRKVSVVRMNVTDSSDHIGDVEAIRSLLDMGKMKTHISQEFAIEETQKAHQQIETHTTKGKIVIKL